MHVGVHLIFLLQSKIYCMCMCATQINNVHDLQEWMQNGLKNAYLFYFIFI